MAKNKTYNHIYFSFEEEGHPIIMDWFSQKLTAAVRMIQPDLESAGLREDSVQLEFLGGQSMAKLGFRTNFLGDQQLYMTLMGYILTLIEDARKYVEIKMHFENSDVRKNRMSISSDLGLMINGSAPIEMRAVGTTANKLDSNIVDIWVAGEPNATRKEVGYIRHLIRTENNHKQGLEWFIDTIREYMPKDVALYIRTKDQPLGQVVHGRAYDVWPWEDPNQAVYKKAVDEGKVPDIFNLKESNNWNFDFIAFMELMTSVVDTLRVAKPGKGGHDIVPYEFIRHVMKDVMEVEDH